MMAKFKFQTDSARSEYEKKYQKLKAIADEKINDTEYLWDKTVQKYATKIERVKKILEMDGINSAVTQKMFKDLGTFLKKCREAEFHIALVGAIKAGKSTLINALLGYEYASTKVTPETAVLTKFKKGSENYLKVSFYNIEEWERLWKSANDAKAAVFLEEYATLNAEKEKNNWLGIGEQTVKCGDSEELVEKIQKWTSSKSACHYFVKEVEVGLKDFGLPDGVALVDTPGLDDVVQYRSDVTRDYIDRANAVLVCVKSDALTGQEWGTICSVFSNTRYNPEKVYIIATQIDTLNRPVENWKDQRAEWLKYLKENSAFGSYELAEKNLIPVSAYFYTLLKAYPSMKNDDDRYWDLGSVLGKFKISMNNVDEHYKEMLDFSNVDFLKRRIQNDVVANYRNILIEDIKGSYGICRDSIKESLARIKKAQQEILETSQGTIEDMKEKEKEYSERCAEAERDKKNLDDLLKKLSVAATKRADELENAIKNLHQNK